MKRNWKKRKPRRKRCWMPKRVATGRSMRPCELRAPAATAGYTQRAPRPGFDRDARGVEDSAGVVVAKTFPRRASRRTCRRSQIF